MATDDVKFQHFFNNPIQNISYFLLRAIEYFVQSNFHNLSVLLKQLNIFKDIFVKYLQHLGIPLNSLWLDMMI